MKILFEIMVMIGLSFSITVLLKSGGHAIKIIYKTIKKLLGHE